MRRGGLVSCRVVTWNRYVRVPFSGSVVSKSLSDDSGRQTLSYHRGVDENIDVEGGDAMKSFRNYKLLRIVPRNQNELAYLRHLFFADGASHAEYELDFWQPPTRVGGAVDLTVAPENVAALFNDLEARGMDVVTVSDDLQNLITKERNSSPSDLQNDKLYHQLDAEVAYRYDRYNPLTAIQEQLFRWRDAHPHLVSIFEIGRTHENRSIYTVKVAFSRASSIGYDRDREEEETWDDANDGGGGGSDGERPSDSSPPRPAFWLDAGIHAREWIAPATAMNLLRKLIDGFNGGDVEIRRLVSELDWYVTVVLNPDGYEYSHTKNRMWRKNRRPVQCKANRHYSSEVCCSGVDLNRNFDWFFGTSGASNDPCHEVYHGPFAFSEPESQAVRNFLKKIPARAFISLHSYSQLWLIPYSHKKHTYPSDIASVLRPLSKKATKALSRLYGTKYSVGTAPDMMYEASGCSHDYARGTLRIPYAFLVELRPLNVAVSSGFLLPESEILATGEETWLAVKVVADEVISRFGRHTTTTTSTSTTSTTTTSTTSTTTTTMPSTTHTSIVTSMPLAHKSITHRAITSSPSILLPEHGSTMRSTIGLSTFHRRSTHRPHHKSRRTTVGTSTSSLYRSRKIITAKTFNFTTAAPASSHSGVELIIMVGLRGTGNGSEQLVVDGGDSVTRERKYSVILPGASSATNRPPKVVQCRDSSHYCRWWKMHRLCEKRKVRELCTLSCLPECQI